MKQNNNLDHNINDNDNGFSVYKQQGTYLTRHIYITFSEKKIQQVKKLAPCKQSVLDFSLHTKRKYDIWNLLRIDSEDFIWTDITRELFRNRLEQLHHTRLFRVGFSLRF